MDFYSIKSQNYQHFFRPVLKGLEPLVLKAKKPCNNKVTGLFLRGFRKLISSVVSTSATAVKVATTTITRVFSWSGFVNN